MLIKDGLKHERDFKDRIIKDLEASRDKERKNLRDVMNKLYDLEKEDEKKEFQKKKFEDLNKNLSKDNMSKNDEMILLKNKNLQKEKKLKDALENMKRHIDDLNRYKIYYK